MAILIKSTPPISGRSARRFLRRMRASDMSDYRKTGCDMGWYGHFVKVPAVHVDRVKLDKVIKRIMEDAK